MARKNRINFYDDLPNEIEVDGQILAIDFSFENILRMMAYERDNEILYKDKVEIMCELLFMKEDGYFSNVEVDNLDSILFNFFNEYINDHDDSDDYFTDIKGNKHKIPKKEVVHVEEEDGYDENVRAIDYIKDQDLIYSSFMKEYGIDLYESKGMHWYKFKALLEGLGPDTIMSRVMDIRTAKMPSSRDGGKERMRMEKLKAYYSLD